jgi:hypothetical protein
MKFIKTILLFLIPLLFLGSQCRKENINILPPETDQGFNTFGCLVNGELFRNGSVTGLNAGISKNILNVGANKGFGNTWQTVGFTINNMVGVGKYILSDKSTGSVQDTKVDSFCWYKTNLLDQTGIVNITHFDTINKIVSGNFSFKAKLFIGSFDSTSIIDVSEGRFDVIYFKH